MNNMTQTAENERERKIKSLLGFACKARKLYFGMEATKVLCHKQRAKAIIIATDLSSNAKEKVKRMITDNRMPIIEFGTKEQLGLLFNRNDVGILSIEDSNIADGIEKLSLRQ